MVASNAYGIVTARMMRRRAALYAIPGGLWEKSSFPADIASTRINYGKRHALVPGPRSAQSAKPMGKADGEKEGKGVRHRTLWDCAGLVLVLPGCNADWPPIGSKAEQEALCRLPGYCSHSTPLGANHAGE